MYKMRHRGRKLALSVSFLICASTSADAQTSTTPAACQTSNTILQSLSVVRNIQSDSKGREYTAHLSTLSALTSQIELSTFTQNSGLDNKNGIAQGPNIDAVSKYVETLQAANAIGKTSARDDARQILIQAITPDVTKSLRSIENYWNCRTRNIVEQTASSDKLADFTGQSAVTTDYTPSETSKTASQDSKTRGLSANSRVLKQSKVGRDVAFYISPPYWLILGFLILGLVIYGLQKRSKGFKARQKRRILNSPVRVRIGKQDVAMMLVDISRNGVKVQHGGALGGEKKVNLYINRQWHAGHIIWSNDTFAGVQFKKPMKAQTFNTVVQETLMAKGVSA